MIELTGKIICFTGEFSNGMKREALHKYAEALGAKPLNYVTKSLYALVIGGNGSDQWVNPGESGRKILKVDKWNNNGCEILYIHETEFMAIRH